MYGRMYKEGDRDKDRWIDRMEGGERERERNEVKQMKSNHVSIVRFSYKFLLNINSKG
jgi:hypothetical protein